MENFRDMISAKLIQDIAVIDCRVFDSHTKMSHFCEFWWIHSALQFLYNNVINLEFCCCFIAGAYRAAKWRGKHVMLHSVNVAAKFKCGGWNVCLVYSLYGIK